MRISILIATSGKRPDLLRRTLTTLAENILPSEYASCVLVENGLRNKTQEISREFSSCLRTQYLFEPAANKSTALNSALQFCDSDIILFLDDDVRVGSDWIMNYSSVAKRFGPGHFFGGPVECDYEREPLKLVQDYLPRSARGWQLPHNSPTRVDGEWFLGFNWAAFRDDLISAGGFDDSYGPDIKSGATGQETMMQHHLRAKGGAPIYIPRATVWHYVPASRCSPDWVIDRQMRATREWILKNAQVGRNQPHVIRYLSICAMRCVTLYLMGTVQRSRVNLFKARLHFARFVAAADILRQRWYRTKSNSRR
jgi:glycosyltransferase involved in cell wall biosynthesis